MEKTIQALFIIYFLGVNFVSFVMYGLYKRKAIRGKNRISENKLFIICGLGGSLGGFLGMHLFHHKTRHREFTVGILLMLIFHVCILAWGLI